jgi:hypothetical protein
MNRTTTLFATVVLVVGTLAGVVPATAAGGATVSADSAAAAGAATTNHTANDSGDAALSPGARLSGVVGVQGAEVRGDVESRAFGIRVAKAATDDAKAEVVAGQLNESERRVDELETDLDELERARASGTISNGAYAARAAEVQAELNNVQRRTDQSAAVARDLPNETLEANGVNVTAIEQLRQRAANLSGPEVAAVARTIAGGPSAMAGNDSARPAANDGGGPDGVADGPPAGGNTTSTTVDEDDTSATGAGNEADNAGGAESGDGPQPTDADGSQPRS